MEIHVYMIKYIYIDRYTSVNICIHKYMYTYTYMCICIIMLDMPVMRVIYGTIRLLVGTRQMDHADGFANGVSYGKGGVSSASVGEAQAVADAEGVVSWG